MFEQKLSSALHSISLRLRQKSLYFELKSHIKNGDTFLKTVRNHDRQIGKTHTLIQLAHEYNCPIAVANMENAKALEKASMFLFKKPLSTVVCDERLRGKRFKLVLCEEGINLDRIYDFLKPNAECVIGYSFLN